MLAKQHPRFPPAPFISRRAVPRLPETGIRGGRPNTTPDLPGYKVFSTWTVSAASCARRSGSGCCGLKSASGRNLNTPELPTGQSNCASRAGLSRTASNSFPFYEAKAAAFRPSSHTPRRRSSVIITGALAEIRGRVLHAADDVAQALIIVGIFIILCISMARRAEAAGGRHVEPLPQQAVVV